MRVRNDVLLDDSGETVATVGSSEWFLWLREELPASFSVQTERGSCTFRYEQRGKGKFWYAYHKQQGKLRKTYAGSSEELTRERIQEIIAKLVGAQTVSEKQYERENKPAAANGYHLSLLGEPRLAVHGETLPLKSAKIIALLAYLALADSSPTRDALLVLLWPESSQEAARKNLQNILWQLRAQQGNAEAELVTHLPNGRLTSHERVEVDARNFLHRASSDLLESDPLEATAEALALYRGPFLEGLVLQEAPEFERWMFMERDRLGREALRLLHLRIDALRAAGAWREVMLTALQALNMDNLQESMHRVLMLAYARLGQRKEALRQYEALCRLLEEELGVAPLPETQRLHQAIVRGNIAAVSSSRSQAEPVEAGTEVNAPFLGRHVECDVLNNELQRVMLSERARVVALAGEMGIGKSRLWEEWSRSLPVPVMQLVAHCLESTQAIPFAPLIRLFTSHLTAGTTALLPPIWLAELARLIPDVRGYCPDLPPPVQLQAGEERGRLFEACNRFLSALTQGPLVFFVDDVQWADTSTLDWLAYLTEQQRQQPLLLVVAYRPEELPRRLGHSLASWERAGIVTHLPLQRLSAQEVQQMIASMQRERADAGRSSYLYRQSAGNPYYLIELLRADLDTIPPSLQRLVQTRVERLPPIPLQLAQAASILEPDLDADLLRRASGRDEDETLEALDALVQAGFLREGDVESDRLDGMWQHRERYLFVHPLAATVVREGLSKSRRAVLHLRAAQALEEAYTGKLAPLAGRLMEHYLQAKMPPRAAHYAEMAGAYALSVAAPLEAVEFYHKAIALEATPERQLGLGQALLGQGKTEEARAVLEQALTDFLARGDMQQGLQTALACFETFTMRGLYVEALLWAEQKMDVFVRDAESLLARILLCLQQSMHYRFVVFSLSQAELYAREAVNLLPPSLHPDLALRCHLILAGALAEQGKWREAVASYREMAAVAHEKGDILEEVLARNNVAYHLLQWGEREAARREIDEAMALNDMYALQMPRLYLYSTSGELSLVEHNWEAAEREFRKCEPLIGEHSDAAFHLASLQANLGRVSWGRGNLGEAARYLKLASRTIAQVPVPYKQSQIDLWLAEIYLEKGEHEAAGEVLRRVEERGELGVLERGAQELRLRLTKSEPNW